MTDPNPLAGLFSALSRAQAAAQAVEQDATNRHHGYSYASAEAIIHETKGPLTRNGLAVVPSEMNVELLPDGHQGAVALLHAEWLVVHESGGSMVIHCDWTIIPEKGRPFDKALAAARTASLGYLLRDLLCLPRVEPGTGLDDDSRDEHHAQEVKPITQAQVDAAKSLMVQLGIAGADQGAYLDTINGGARATYEDGVLIIAALRGHIAARKAVDDAKASVGKQPAPTKRTQEQTAMMVALCKRLDVDDDKRADFLAMVADGVDAKTMQGAAEVIQRLQKRVAERST